MPIDQTRFLTCWPDTLAQECPFPNDWSNPRNFSNDAHDPGGATMDGIIQAEFDRYCDAHGFVRSSVRNISKNEGQDIYFNNFWMPHCPLLPVGLDLQLFDTNVNQGPKEGIRILQVALGVQNDGVWGPKTQAAAALEGPAILAAISAFTARRRTVYQQTSGYQYFGRDWIRRAGQIGTEAAAMATGSSHQESKFFRLGYSHVPRAVWGRQE